MREEDKNYNLEEDDEDENFMIGGTDDDLDEEPEEPEGPEGEEEAEARVNKKPERKITPNKAADTERVNTKKEKKTDSDAISSNRSMHTIRILCTYLKKKAMGKYDKFNKRQTILLERASVKVSG